MRARLPDISAILVHFRPTGYDDVECLGQVVAQFHQDFVMRTPIKLMYNDCLFLRFNTRAIADGLKEIQAFGRVVSQERLADGKLGYLIHIL